EDQGAASVQFRLPAGATQARTQEVQLAVEKYLREQEGRNVRTIFTVTGGGGGGGASGQNTGQGFVNFVSWDDRPGKENSADAIVQRAA
ncbi:efflux RND transporter permease subunit, partial [Phosphitispora fastidiosa]